MLHYRSNSFFFQIFTLLLSYFLLSRLLFFIYLEPNGVFTPSQVDVIQYLGLFLSVGAAFFFKKMKWNLFENAHVLKWFVFFSASIITYKFSFSGFDFYADSWRILYKLSLLLATLLILWRPLFVAVHIIIALSFAFSCFHDFGQYYLKHEWIVINMLLLSSAFFYANHIIRLDARFLIQSLIVFQLLGYFTAGIFKVVISPGLYEWVLENDLSLLLLNANLRGWLHQWRQEYFELFYHLLHKYYVFLNALVLFIEIGFGFFFLNSKLARFLLFGVILFHLGTIAIAGIFFWIWILMDIAILVILFRMDESLKGFLFSRQSFSRSLLILVVSFILVRPPVYAWFDSPFQWFVEIEVEDKEGMRFIVDKLDFGLYEPYFTQDYLSCTIRDNLLSPSGYATNDYKEFSALRNIDTVELNNVIRKYAQSQYDPERDSFLETFLTNHFQTVNESLGNEWRIGYPGSLKQLYMHRVRESKFQYDRKINKVNLIINKYFFFNGKYNLLSRSLYKTFKINS